jgi:hypothetical protein
MFFSLVTQCDRVQQIVELLNLEEWIDEDTEPEEPAD